MSKRSKHSNKFGKPGIGNLYHGYRKETKQKLIKQCKCGDYDEKYVLVIDPETNEVEGGIKINTKKKSSPTRKSKPSLKKGGRKKTLKRKNMVKKNKNKNKTRNKNKTKKYQKKRKAKTNKKRQKK